jgi:hypothetical protein
LVKVFLNNIEHSKEIFEIQNSEINVSELMQEIESNLKQRLIDKTEIERIAKLKISADSPAGHREFDPSLTANLFEKGIAPPKFSNPRYWFIRGPLKWAIVKFTEIYSIVDKKLSENRIKAFYSVLHELILLKVKHSKLEKKVNELYNHIIELRTATRPNFFQNEFYDNNKPLEECFRKSNLHILSLLKKEKATLVLLPDWENFLNLLKVNTIQFHVIVQNKIQFDYIHSQITNRITNISSIHSYTDFKNYSNIVLHCNACLLPAWVLENILLIFKMNADSSTQFFLRFSNSAINYHSPFQENYQTRIELEKLLNYLQEAGFKNVVSHFTEKEELNLITFSIP